jgi:tRNA threonylcarbamoyl adenosine modification protein YjeE
MSVAKPDANAGEKLAVLASKNILQTNNVATALARQCKSGDCILLEGGVGAGKTSFARAFIQAICPVQEEIVSPTFTILQTYPLNNGESLSHFDLYRLENEQDLQEIGLDDALCAGITVIEWPEIAKNRLPASALHIAMSGTHTENERILLFSGHAEIWQERLNKVKEALHEQ